MDQVHHSFGRVQLDFAWRAFRSFRVLGDLVPACALVAAAAVCLHVNATPADCTEGAWIPTFQGVNAPNGIVYGIVASQSGTDRALYAGGYFSAVGGQITNNVAKWDGSSWSPLGGGMSDSVMSLVMLNTANGPRLYAGGGFTYADGNYASRVAYWDGIRWLPASPGANLSGMVRKIFAVDDGNGQALYISGDFVSYGCNRIARLSSNSTWTPLGSGLSASATAMEAFNDGTGTALFVSGAINVAGGVSCKGVAKWNGTAWSAVGGGTSQFVVSAATALAVYDDGTGSALYAGLNFTWNGGATDRGIAKLVGNSWELIATDMENAPRVLKVFDDGAGPALWACGDFTHVNGVPADRIAKWRANSWTAISGGGVGGSAIGMDSWRSSTGRYIFVGGAFIDSPAGDSRLAVFKGCPADPPCPGDLNGTGAVDGQDLGMLLGVWGAGSGTAMDINRDGVVNGADLGLLLSAWGPCAP